MTRIRGPPSIFANILENLFMEFDPIGDTTRHGPDMDKVKVIVGIRPFLGNVVDFELAVGRHKRRLDW